MAGRTGTHDISTLLAATTTSIAAFGYNNINDILQQDIANWNTQVGQIVEEFCAVTTDRQRVAGSSTTNYATKVNEYGRSATQREIPPGQMGFPLEKYQYAIGWTRLWFETHSPYDMAIAQIAAQRSFKRAIVGAIKSAMYLSANYTFTDMNVDNVALAVKRFANADSFPIPDGPNGEVFTASSHTHYLANASLTAAAVNSAINTVIEHGYGGAVRIYIAQADLAAWQALTGFVAYIDPRIILPTTATAATAVTGQRLDITRLDNRAVGIFGAAEVWVKPWAIANYALIFDASPTNKTLVFRQRDSETMQGMRLAAEFDGYPLHAQYYEMEFGVGVWTRLNGAVLYYAGGSYVDPAITGYVAT